MSECTRFEEAIEAGDGAGREALAHLATCPGCTALRDLGPALGIDAASRSGDGALLEGAISGALREVPSMRRASHRRSASRLVLPVAAVLLVVSGAFAAYRLLRREEAPPSPPRFEVASATAERVAPQAPELPASAATADRPAPSASEASIRESPPPRTAKAVSPSTATPPPEPAPAPTSTAAELFADANAARRRGASADAIDRYRELGRRFPGSREEVAARVLLGNLLLPGDPGAALALFDAYLGQGSAALAEEAHLGRAQALERLGRAAEARRAWETLLERFPHSIHGARARAKLGGSGL
jgi:TolA-binding protein